MPRASWRGFLRLSLVSCPIYLSPATTRTKPIRAPVAVTKPAYTAPLRNVDGLRRGASSLSRSQGRGNCSS